MGKENNGRNTPPVKHRRVIEKHSRKGWQQELELRAEGNGRKTLQKRDGGKIFVEEKLPQKLNKNEDH